MLIFLISISVASDPVFISDSKASREVSSWGPSCLLPGALSLNRTWAGEDGPRRLATAGGETKEGRPSGCSGGDQATLLSPGAPGHPLRPPTVSTFLSSSAILSLSFHAYMAPSTKANTRPLEKSSLC